MSGVLLFISLLVDEVPLVLLTDITSLPQQSRPHLNPHDAKDEENEEAEKEDVTKHGQSVQQEHHKDPHA